MTTGIWAHGLVTGASSGLGWHLARALARAGTRVVLAARRVEALEQLAEGIAADGGEAEVFALDVGDTERTVSLIRELDASRPLDLVVANAGVGPPLGATPFSWEALAGPTHVNYCGAAATLTAALPAMVERRRGHLVGIGSLSSFGALPGSGAYCSPKAGLAMLLDCLRLDVASRGVAVTNVYLGFVDTPMVHHREGPMPQLMQPAALASKLVERLERRPASLTLPQALGVVTRLAAAVPRPLRDAVIEGLARVARSS